MFVYIVPLVSTNVLSAVVFKQHFIFQHGAFSLHVMVGYSEDHSSLQLCRQTLSKW